jgi:hypothetical protein
MYQPRGKVLGGTSSINGMVYMRGNPPITTAGASAAATGWDWDSVLPFFKKAEDQERGPNEFHGVGGPLRVSDPVRWKLGDAWCRGGDRGRHAGQRRFQRRPPGRRRHFQMHDEGGAALEHGTRLSRPAKGRANLTIETEAHATASSSRAKGRRRRLPASAACLGRRAPRRDRRLRRRLRLAAAVAAIGLGPGRIAAGIRHSGGARHAGRGQAPAGPFLCPSGLSLHPADHAQRPGGNSVRCAPRPASVFSPIRVRSPATAFAPAPSQERPAPLAARHAAQISHLELWAATAPACKPHPFPASASARCICAPTRAARCGSRAPTRWRRRRSASTSSRRNTTSTR